MVQGAPQSAPVTVQPAGALSGSVSVPGDKSISHRYVMLSAVARGASEITNLGPGADVGATMACCRALGVEITTNGLTAVRINGRGWAGLSQPPMVLDAANSGTTIRLMSGLLAGRPLEVTLTGDESLRRRPMARVIDPLVAMGAGIQSLGGRAPLTIRGGHLRGIEWRPPVASAQIKSALMLAALSAAGRTRIIESHATRDHSELAFPAFSLRADVDGLAISVEGGQEAVAPPSCLEVPGDPSSAAVWAAAAAGRPGSRVRLTSVCLNPRRLGFVRALRLSGAEVSLHPTHTAGGEIVGDLEVRHRGHGSVVIDAAEVPDLIDELPVLAARAAIGGSLDVSGAAELRVKESDRISALVTGLRRLGVQADERPDGFTVRGDRPPAGGVADAAGDHRLVMAFAIVGIGATGPTAITDAGAVSVSYPDFFHDLARLTT